MSQYDVRDTPIPPCPICGAEAEQRIWTETYPGMYNGGSIAILTPKHRGTNVPATVKAIPLVCMKCGYVQFFVNPEYFRNEQ